MQNSETIAAIATAPAPGAVAIIRISGPGAYPIADEIFRSGGAAPSDRPAYTFAHGTVCDSTGTELDEVLMLFMRAPRSFTREDVVEIHTHGGQVVAARILRRILEAGARAAEPGEFTRRAFLNGRIDLVQAEAVMDLILARTERAASVAIEQLEGGLSKDVNQLYDLVLGADSDLEATLDFSEEDLPEPVLPDIRARLRQARQAAQALVSTWEEGHLVRDGAIIVLAGSPNAGKSTLMNVLLGVDRAIVSHLPGTTRDVIEEGCVLDGLPIRLVDTAGLRDTECAIEQEGIRRTERQVEQADVTLLVLDGSRPLAPEDAARLHSLDSRRTLVVLNKRDLGMSIRPEDVAPHAAVQTSLVRGSGLDEVRAQLLVRLRSDAQSGGRPRALISERHRRLLVEAGRETKAALDLLENTAPDGHVLAASHLRDALELLGFITGRVYHDDLLDTVFTRFCIGK